MNGSSAPLYYVLVGFSTNRGSHKMDVHPKIILISSELISSERWRDASSKPRIFIHLVFPSQIFLRSPVILPPLTLEWCKNQPNVGWSKIPFQTQWEFQLFPWLCRNHRAPGDQLGLRTAASATMHIQFNSGHGNKTQIHQSK